MNTYNKIMERFWLIVSIVVFLLVTYKCIEEGFDRWAFYYLFVLLALFTWFMRRYMRRRMEKHNAFLSNQQKEKNNV